MLIQVIFTAFSVLIGYVLQTALLPFIPFLPVVPNLMLIITMSFAVLYGTRTGMAVGLISGLLLDLAGGGALGFYGLAFLYIGYLNGLLKRFLTEDQILVPIVLCLADEILCSGYTYVFHFLVQKKLEFSAYFFGTFMPELVITLISVIVVYGILMYLSHQVADRKRRKKDIRFVS